MRLTYSLALAVLACWPTLVPAEPVPLGRPDFVPTPERPIGFCGDGNSWFPGATPPVEWWDGTPGWAKVRHRGGMGNSSPPFDDSTTEAEMRVLLDRVPKNILWKVPVPGWGDSLPIVVGKRIINCYWPQLIVCYDTETGKELWRDELELCLLPQLEADRRTIGPAPDAREARKLQTLLELGHAMRHLSHNLRDFQGKDPGPAEVPLVKKAIERMGEWRNTLQAVWPQAVTDLDFDIETAKRFLAGEYGVLGLGAEKLQENSALLKTTPQFGLGRARGLVRFAERTCGTNIDNSWGGAWCPYQASSPTSDGQIVAVRFANGQVGAHEVATGKRLWAWRDPKVNSHWTYHCPSPRIGREVVVLDAFWNYDAKYDDPNLLPPGVKGRDPKTGQIKQSRRWGSAGSILGIDKRTGRVRWWQWQRVNSGYPSSTPLLLDLDDGKGGILPVVIGTGGDIFRQSDGKTLAKLDVDETAESHTLHRGNMLFSVAKAGGRMLTRVFRLHLVSKDEVRAEVVRDIPEIRTFRACTAMSDAFLFGRGGFGLDLTTMKVVAYTTPMAIGTAEARGVTIAGRYHIFPSYNGNDEKFRSRQDGMCLLTFNLAEVPRYPGSPPVFVSDRSLLGGPEVAADLFFDKYLSGFDKMRQVTPKKWCGRYGSHLPAFFGHRFGGPVPYGDRLYIQSQCFLYCIGPAVKGTPADDPKVVAGIRAETDTAKLATHLTGTSAQYRCEAVKRIGALKAALPAAVGEALTKLLVDDAYEEVRAAALVALDACDPQGEAGWAALVAGEFSPCYATEIHWGRPGHREQQERRRRLPLLFRALGKDAPAVLAARWPQPVADPVQHRAMLEVATALGLRVEPMLKTALEVCQDPTAWRNDRARNVLPAYFAAIDAAADPAVAEVLMQVYPTNWTLFPTFNRHLPRDKKLAWLETAAMENIGRQQTVILQVWRDVGPEAIPFMERVAAKLSADPKNGARLSYAQVVAEAIAAVEAK